MALELTAVRVLAQVVGVSLYTWTGVIGVMLAGTACGNWLGGVLADRAGKKPDPTAGANTLAGVPGRGGGGGGARAGRVLHPRPARGVR